MRYQHVIVIKTSGVCAELSIKEQPRLSDVEEVGIKPY